jgi:hypothetical protein
VSRKGWKAVERSAAALMNAKRFPANVGERLDFEGPTWIGQVKNVKTMSLAAIEALAIEMERLAMQKGKLGAIIVKRSAGSLAERDALGRQIATPHLVIVTEATWREMTGRLPTEDKP